MDPWDLQRCCVLLGRLAEQARGAAARAAAGRQVDWTSVAADHFRQLLTEESARAGRCADRLDAAGAALAHHLRAVRTVASPPWAGPRR